MFGFSQAFGGPVHISGVVNGHTKSSIAHHISGRPYSVINSPVVKTNISGTKRFLPSQKHRSIQSRLQKKTRNMGIILGEVEKPTSSEIENQTTEKTSVATKKYYEQKGLSEQIKKRKACWKTCENSWKVNIRERCFALSGLLKENCEKENFEERLLCVKKTCR